ncbi:MAG TPA: nuclear transport factor 2 family protein [Steroidobacteraceae bacterium]
MPTRLGVAAIAAAAMILVAAQPADARSHKKKPAQQSPTPTTKITPELRARLDQLEAEVNAAEDVRAIEKLQRAYGYYVDKGMWEDVAALFTEDAVANYPAGVYVGHASIRQHLFENVGGRKMGDLGLGDGRLYNHMQIQPVVHLDPGGKTAKGRWRAFAMFGSFGGSATWAEGVYEFTYAKDHGVWKIRTLDYYSGFGAPYQTGWVPQPPRSEPPGGRKLQHPPDRERKMDCDGFPAACIAPFHYENPGTNATAARVWTTVEHAGATKASATKGDVVARAQSLAHRALLLEDGQKIENLQRIYGYYIDRGMWDQAADLFASDGTMEWGQSGVYVGKTHVRRFFNTWGPQGLRWGHLSDHLQLQPIVDVGPSGLNARSRSRELDLTADYGGKSNWTEGVYENSYVKQGGVWKFKSLHFYPTFITDYDKGWAKDAQPMPVASVEFPPDKPSSETYEIYPKAHVPPFHYRNPVTGDTPHYPPVGGPTPELAASALMTVHLRPRKPVVDDAGDLITAAERRVGRVKDYFEIENLESAYGYYLDKNLFNNLADLFAKDGAIELAQRGVYKGQDHVRQFLMKAFTRDGKEGPVENRLGNHLQIQPVIDVAEDGQSAKVRIRMFQQMSLGGRASIGGAVYENELVKEGGVWRFEFDHTYNTFSAGYEGGLTRAAGRGMPGPTPGLAWDAPPTQVIDMFPVVYDIPFHYSNPVMGHGSAKPLERPLGMPANVAAALREIGPKIDGVKTAEIYAALQPKGEPYGGVTVTRDLHYGPHERHVLDVFAPEARPAAGGGGGPGAGGAPAGGGGTPVAAGRPVIVFVHGGGFNRGAKHTPNSIFFDNIGVWAVDHGLIGVTINYRLAPEYPWPSGIEDLTMLVAWLKAHVAEYGGDPNRIFLWGHSAGAAHVGDYVAHQSASGADTGIAGAILTSGFYDLGDKVSIWKDYYGTDVSQYAARSSLPQLLKTSTPLFVSYAELDPENFQADSIKLIQGRAADNHPVPSIRLPAHSHISETYAVGSGDESLSGPVLSFVRMVSGSR